MDHHPDVLILDAGNEALGCVLVFFHHHPTKLLEAGPLLLWWELHIGVTLFFVLSGFVITWRYDRRGPQRAPESFLRGYFVNRFARIYPLYLLLAVLSIPFLVGLLGAPAVTTPPVASADELAQAQAAQRALQRKIADQKAQIAKLNSSQASLAGAIRETQSELKGITNYLAATQRRVSNLIDDIDVVKAG